LCAAQYGGSAGHTGSFGHGSLRPTVHVAIPSTTVASVVGSQMHRIIIARRQTARSTRQCRPTTDTLPALAHARVI